MKLLELFAGTGSVGKEWERLGLGEVVSVDVSGKFGEPTYCVDILEWDYKAFPPGHFDAVWASPLAPNTRWRARRRIALATWKAQTLWCKERSTSSTTSGRPSGSWRTRGRAC